MHVQTIITRATATTKTLADKTIAVYSQTNPCFPSRNWGLRIPVMLMKRDTTHLESWSVFDLFKIHKSINSKKEKIGSFSMRIGDCYTQSEVPKAQFSVFRSRKKKRGRRGNAKSFHLKRFLVSIVILQFSSSSGIKMDRLVGIRELFNSWCYMIKMKSTERKTKIKLWDTPSRVSVDLYCIDLAYLVLLRRELLQYCLQT